jgi:MFS family permease
MALGIPKPKTQYEADRTALWIVGMYIIARMILGFGIPTCIVSGSSLIGELAYPKERPIMTSLFNVSYFVGQIVAAAICFGTNNIESNWAWRIPSLLQICPSLLQLTFVLWVHASIRSPGLSERTTAS